MPKTVSKHPWLSIVVAIVSLSVVFWTWTTFRSVGADTQGPASIIVASVTIATPQSGGSVYVNAKVDGTYTEGSGYLEAWARSVTQDNLLHGGQPQWYALSVVASWPGKPASVYGYVQAAYGDLIELKASNWYMSTQHTDIEQVGYVPAGSDTAPPEFQNSYISESWSSGWLTVSIDAYYGVWDPSYPIALTLSEIDNPSNSTSATITSSSGPFPVVLSLPVALYENVRLRAADTYGNARSQLYNTSELGWPAATGAFTPEPEQSPAEPSGQQAVGGLGVQLHNGSLIHSEELLRVRGRTLALELAAVHRTLISHEGVLGTRWDSLLSSRIAIDAEVNITWWPGNGRQEFFPSRDDGDYWESPIGLFVRVSELSGVYTFEFADGRKLVYVNNRLDRLEDRYGQQVRFVRDSGGRVFRILDDLGRRYDLAYFDHGRLAETVDYTGRRAALDYDASFNLRSIIDEGGYTRRFEYAGTRLARRFDRNDREIVESFFDGAGKVTAQEFSLGASQKDGATGVGTYTFNYTDQLPADPELTAYTVTDPLGTVREYDFSTNAPIGLLKKVITRENATLRALADGYEWSTVPLETAVCIEHDAENLLPERTWNEAFDGSVWEKTTPYTWSFWSSAVQDDASDDPRTYGNLRVRRRDRKIDDLLREYASERESFTYTEAYNQVAEHWSPRAWIGALPGSDPASPELETNWGNWDTTLDGAFVTEHIHSTSGNLLEVWHPDVSVPQAQTGAVDLYTYNSYGQVLTHSDPSAVLTRFQYYPSTGAGLGRGLLERRWIDIPGSTADPSDRFEYDALDRVIARIDGRGYRWETSWDDLDRVVEERAPPAPYFGVLATTTEYDGEHVLEVRVPNRDELGQVPSGEPGDIVTTYDYDAASGALVRTVSDVRVAQDHETLYEHDKLLRTVRTHEQYWTLASGTKEYRLADGYFDELGRSVRTVDYLSDPDDASPGAPDDDAVADVYHDGAGRRARETQQVGLDSMSVMQKHETLSSEYYDDENEPNPLLRYLVVRTVAPDGTISESVSDTEAGAGDWMLRTSRYVVAGTPPLETEVSRSEAFADERGREYRRRVWFELGATPRSYDEETWYDVGRSRDPQLRPVHRHRPDRALPRAQLRRCGPARERELAREQAFGDLRLRRDGKRHVDDRHRGEGHSERQLEPPVHGDLDLRRLRPTHDDDAGRPDAHLVLRFAGARASRDLFVARSRNADQVRPRRPRRRDEGARLGVAASVGDDELPRRLSRSRAREDGREPGESERTRLDDFAARRLGSGSRRVPGASRRVHGRSGRERVVRARRRAGRGERQVRVRVRSPRSHDQGDRPERQRGESDLRRTARGCAQRDAGDAVRGSRRRDARRVRVRRRGRLHVLGELSDADHDLRCGGRVPDADRPRVRRWGRSDAGGSARLQDLRHARRLHERVRRELRARLRARQRRRQRRRHDDA